MRRALPLLVMLALSACSTQQATATPDSPPTSTIPAPSSPPVPATGGSTPTPAPAQNAAAFPDPHAYKWTPVVTGLVEPTDIQFPDDGSGRMFVLEQPGTILLVRNGQVAPTPFLDIRSKVGNAGSEQGLLGLAFHPDFAHNPYFYLNYTDNSGNTVIARFTANGDTADPASEKLVLHVDQPFPNHNGGVLAFGPDGYLYAGLGDGGSEGDPLNNGQNKGVLLAKVLRIDVDHGDPYSIPPGNPFGNETWEYGLRNPWRISFDRANGGLYIADVGQDSWEEVDHVPAGQGGLDFGWSYREGLHRYKGSPPAGASLVDPVVEYSHVPNRCAITGGYVYRGSMPEWQGIYLYADFCSGEMWGLMRSGAGWTSQLLFNTGSTITTFGQDTAGELYYASRDGTVYKLGK
jgi:glucose/arabinose dehydrogenase